MSRETGKLRSIVQTVALILAAPFAHAAIVIDQQGLTSSDVVSGGVNPGIQSFQPSVNNIAGIDVFLYSVAKFDGNGGIDYTADVTFSLYQATGPEDFSYASNSVLASGTFLLDTLTTREGWAEFRFAPLAVTPDSYYIFEVTTDNGFFGVSSNNSYLRGQRLEPGLGRDYFDMHFISYADTEFNAIPLPAAAWLFGFAMTGLAGFKIRKL